MIINISCFKHSAHPKRKHVLLDKYIDQIPSSSKFVQKQCKKNLITNHTGRSHADVMFSAQRNFEFLQQNSIYFAVVQCFTIYISIIGICFALISMFVKQQISVVVWVQNKQNVSFLLEFVKSSIG